MNLKEYFRLAGLFGKLNSQEKLEDDFTTTPEGETLRFFWESCEQEKIDLYINYLFSESNNYC